jgi:hypothetical protein
MLEGPHVKATLRFPIATTCWPCCGRPSSAGHRGRPLSRISRRVSDRDLERFTFGRYDAEAMQVIPVVEKKWLVTLHA